MNSNYHDLSHLLQMSLSGFSFPIVKYPFFNNNNPISYLQVIQMEHWTQDTERRQAIKKTTTEKTKKNTPDQTKKNMKGPQGLKKGKQFLCVKSHPPYCG